MSTLPQPELTLNYKKEKPGLFDLGLRYAETERPQGPREVCGPYLKPHGPELLIALSKLWKGEIGRAHV